MVTWPGLVLSPLYCVIFSKHPAEDVEHVVAIMRRDLAPAQLVGLVADIEAVLASPEHEVRRVYDFACDPSEEELRVFLAGVARGLKG